MKLFLSLFITVILTGCAASGPQFTIIDNISNDQAVIYFYRSNTITLASSSAYFHIDGDQVSTLSRNGYSAHIVSAGEHEIRMTWGQSLRGFVDFSKFPRFDVTIKPGDSKFFNLSTSGTGNNIVYSFVEVDEGVALAEIESHRLE